MIKIRIILKGSIGMKKILVEYLYLDLDTCDRCIGTDTVLEEVIDELKILLISVIAQKMLLKKTLLTIKNL